MNDLKLSTDGFWKTRDGRKVRIYAIDGSRGRSVHGAIFDGDEWYHYTWTAPGTYYFLSEADSDIIGRWPEEKTVEAWVWLWSNGEVESRNYTPQEWRRSVGKHCPHVIGAVHLTGTVIEGKFE